MLGATAHHVTKSGIPSVAGGRTFASAAGVVWVNVTAMGPTIVGIVVEASGVGVVGCCNDWEGAGSGLEAGLGLLVLERRIVGPLWSCWTHVGQSWVW